MAQPYEERNSAVRTRRQQEDQRRMEFRRAIEDRCERRQLLAEIGDTIGIMPGTTICGLADGAAWPIKNCIKKFRPELEAFIKKTNPTGYAESKAVPAMELLAVH